MFENEKLKLASFISTDFATLIFKILTLFPKCDYYFKKTITNEIRQKRK